ncbi:MAG: ion transporter [Clostridiales bacterium]|nr:ion transporter [Clostridiales bacterium]
MTKKKLFRIISIGQLNDIPSRLYDIGTMIAVILTIILSVADTFEIGEAAVNLINIVEFITVIFFTVDYGLRIYTAKELYPDSKKPTIKYLFSISGIVNFFSSIPFFFPTYIGRTALRLFRIVRILRVLRIQNYSSALTLVTRVLTKKKLPLLSSVFILLLLVLSASLLIYNAEHAAQPEAFKNAFSGMWWATSALFTVGYGDIVPITILGRLFASILTFLGVLVVAIPTGILSAGFVEEFSLNKENKNDDSAESQDIIFCPYCGKKIKK